MSSLILHTGTRAVFHTIVVFSLYLLFAGHNAPGGGFVGGLVASAAVVLLFLNAGADGLRKAIPIAPQVALGVGVLLATGTGIAAVLVGGEFLQSGVVELSLPVLGDIKATSVLVFDIGVYLVVVGLALAVLETLGSEMEARQ